MKLMGIDYYLSSSKLERSIELDGAKLIRGIACIGTVME